MIAADVPGLSRRPAVSGARYAAGYLGVRELKLGTTRLTHALGISLRAVLRGAESGADGLFGRGVKPTPLLRCHY